MKLISDMFNAKSAIGSTPNTNGFSQIRDQFNNYKIERKQGKKTITLSVLPKTVSMRLKAQDEARDKKRASIMTIKNLERIRKDLVQNRLVVIKRGEDLPTDTDNVDRQITELNKTINKMKKSIQKLDAIIYNK